LIRVTVGPNPLDMGNWTVPSKIVLPELPSRVDASEGADVGVTRSVCYDGVATPYSAKDFWLNSYGNVKGKLSGTFSWSAPEKDVEVTIFKLWWSKSCSKNDIVQSVGPLWIDVFRNPTTENSKYTISITDLAIPDGATTVLLVSHDLNANPWPGAVGVSIKGN